MLDSVIAHLRNGQVVAAATESSFGLLADPTNPTALEALFTLKGRDRHNPIGLILPQPATLTEVAEAPPEAHGFAAKFWPGPMSLVVEARNDFAHLSPKRTVSVRVPGPSPALTIVRAFCGPLTATSANLSGQPALLTAGAVKEVFPKGVWVVDGTAPGGPPSTIVRWGPVPTILRSGRVSDAAVYSAI